MRLCSRKRDKIGDGFDRQRRIDDQKIGRDRQHRDRRHVAHRIVAQIFIEIGPNGMRRASAHQQRVAVGIGCATAAAPIFPPAPGLSSTTTGWPKRDGKLIADQPRDDVGGSAGSERHHDLNGPRRPIVRRRAGADASRPTQQQKQVSSSSPSAPHSSPDDRVDQLTGISASFMTLPQTAISSLICCGVFRGRTRHRHGN